jgi:cytochrome b pre-mRNA-processing protein 3
MLKLLSRLSNRFKASQRPERVDAARIYAKIMKQARNPAFFSKGLLEDNTDGRMEWLAAHLSVVLHALQNHGEDGAKLSQAIYDTMVDDFDVALREEGLSDSGVKHRIKPLAKMFLSRARTYAEVLNVGDASPREIIQKYVLQEKGASKELDELSAYIEAFSSNFKDLALDQIAGANFEFPLFSELTV